MQASSVDEVAGLLKEKGFREDVIQLFESNGIDGEAFLLLEDDKDLEKLGVTQLGERLKLRKLIRDAIASNGITPGSSGTTAESVRPSNPYNRANKINKLGYVAREPV